VLGFTPTLGQVRVATISVAGEYLTLTRGYGLKLIEAQIVGVGGECGEECHRFFGGGGVEFHTIWKKKVTKLSRL